MKELSEIKNRLIRLEEVFQAAAPELKKKTGVRDFYFLLPSPAGNFITKHSTRGGRPFFTTKEAGILNQAGQELIFPQKEFKSKKYRLIKRGLLAKFRLKLWLYQIGLIMPIYLEGELICLILFRDWPGHGRREKEFQELKKIRAEIQAGLASVLLYNQALNRLIETAEA